MKKTLKSLVMVVLVLALAMSLFSGCTPDVDPTPTPTPPALDVTTKYGISVVDKIVTYDGKAHTLVLTEDSSKLGGKAYTAVWSYTRDGAATTLKSFTDAGIYVGTAKIKVDGDATEYTLTAKLTINKYKVDLAVKNLFMPVGGSITSPYVLFSGVELVDNDTISSLGNLTFEVFQGGSKVNNITTIKAMTKASEALTVRLNAQTAKNYEIVASEGKLFVLEQSSYNRSATIAEDIKNAPKDVSALGKLDYNKMRSFVSGAARIDRDYATLTDLEKLFTGSIDAANVKTLAKTAQTRIDASYSVDFEYDSSAIEKPMFNGAKYDSTLSGNSKYLSGNINKLYAPEVAPGSTTANNSDIFRVLYDATLSNVENPKTEFSDRGPSASDVMVGDKFKFSITVKDTTANQLVGLTIRGKDVGLGDGGKTVSGNAVKYTYVLDVTSSLLGALDGKGYLNITPIVQPLYKFSYQPKTKADEEGVSTLNISKGVTMFEVSGTDGKFTSTEGNKTLSPFAQEYKITIYPREGYQISKVIIGDREIDYKLFEKNSYTFILNEDIIANRGVIKISTESMQAYEFQLMVDGRTIRDTEKNGIFTTDKGTVTVSNASYGAITSILQGDTARIKVTPNANLVVGTMKIVGGDVDVDVNGKITVTDLDVLQYYDAKTGVLEIPLEKGSEMFPKELPRNSVLKLEMTYAPIYNFNVLINERTASVSNNLIYSGTQGKVEIYNKDGDLINKIKKSALTETSSDKADNDKLSADETFSLYITANSGYVVKNIKVNGASMLGNSPIIGGSYEVVSSNSTEEKTRLEHIRYINYGDASYNKIVTSIGGAKYKGYYTTADITSISRLEAGENINIEVEFEAYYLVSYDFRAESSTVGIGGESTGNAGKQVYITRLPHSTSPTSLGNPNPGTSDVLQPLKLDISNRNYYVLERNFGKGIGLTVGSRGSSDANPKQYVIEEITIGKEKAVWEGTSTSFRTLSTTVEEAAKGMKYGDTISVDFYYFEKPTTSN